MDSPTKQYKTLGTINDIKDIAYRTLFTKYIIEDKRAEKKLWEIDSTDQESLMKAKNGGFPIPGFIYTFIYPPTQDDLVEIKLKSKTKEYVDYVPIVFCIKIKKDKLIGINLNTLPELERVKFLETYWRGYKTFFEDIEKITENNKLALNMSYISNASSKKGQDIIKIFDEYASANFNYGYRIYKLKKIKILRMVEYCEWNYIPFYNPKDAFKKMNQKQIHELYYRTL